MLKDTTVIDHAIIVGLWYRMFRALTAEGWGWCNGSGHGEKGGMGVSGACGSGATLQIYLLAQSDVAHMQRPHVALQR